MRRHMFKFNCKNISRTFVHLRLLRFLLSQLPSSYLYMAARGSRGGRASNTLRGAGRNTTTSRGRGAPAAASSGPRGHTIAVGIKTRETLPREKANTNPAQIIKDNTQQRRTSEQVRQDNKKAAAAAAATKDANEKAERDRIQRLAEAEDDLRKEDVEYKKHAMRPDLLPSKGKGTG